MCKSRHPVAPAVPDNDSVQTPTSVAINVVPVDVHRLGGNQPIRRKRPLSSEHFPIYQTPTSHALQARGEVGVIGNALQRVNR